MTIKLENQFVCQFSIGPYEDFILLEDLQELKYIEYAGNVLPTIELQFILRNKDVVNYFNEGNILNVSLGRTQLDMIDLQFRLTDDDSTKNFSLGQNITLYGVLSLPEFTHKTKVKMWGKKTSIEVISELVKKYFIFKTNINRTIDQQYFYQQNQTDWEFLDEVWLHSYINNKTFIALGFDCNTLFLKDIAKALESENPWTITCNKISNENSKIINIAGYITSNSYGLANDIMGRNNIPLITNTETGKESFLDYRSVSLTSIGTDKLNKMSSNNSNFLNFYNNSNVSSNYDTAFRQNLDNLLTYSNYRIIAQYAGQFKTLKVLDIVNLDNDSFDERTCGKAFVTRIIYHLVNKKLMTNIMICKEGPNDLKGELKK